jgi:uncharacterized protein YjbI with pentapeptide repeats
MADKQLVEMIKSGVGADFRGTSLQGADLRGADLRGAFLKGASLYNANLQGADLVDANLMGADLSGAKLYDADFRGANLQDANLKGANLYNATLQDADLYDANLQGADLFEANFRNANLRGADLRGAFLVGAKLTGADLRGILYDSKTKWPKGFTPPVGGRFASRKLTVPDQHQLKILIDNVKNPLKGKFLGGPSAEEAEEILREKFRYTDAQIKKLKGDDFGGGRMASRGGRKASTMAPIKFASTHPFDIAEQSAESEEILSWDMLTDGITRRAKLFSRLALDTIMPQDEIVTDFTIFGVTYRNRPVYVNFDFREVLEKCRRLFYREEDEFPEYGKCKVSMSVRIAPYGKDVREISEDDFNGNELGLRMNCYFQAIVKIEDLSSTREVYEDFFELEESSYIVLPISAEEVEFPVSRSASRRLSRFEEGVPADPTENMSPEDAAEWEEMNEKYGDKFKKASGGTRYAAGKIVAREPYMRALQRMQDAFDRSGGDPVKLYDAIDRRVRATRELGKLQGIYDAIVFDVMRGTFGPVPRFLDVRYKALLEQLQKALYMSRSAQY